jgi:hypothetical protein
MGPWAVVDRGDVWSDPKLLSIRMGREASPSAAVLDSQSVKSAKNGYNKAVDYDAGKEVKGGKI